MAKRWLVFSRGINLDEGEQYVKFKEIRANKPAGHEPYDPNVIDSVAASSNDYVVQVELDPPPLTSVVCLGNNGIKYPLSSQEAQRFKTISELFENFWEKLPQFHKKSREKPDGCTHCMKEHGNMILGGESLSWLGSGGNRIPNVIQLRKKAGKWYLCVLVSDGKNIRIDTEFEVSSCPWCGRELN